MSCFLIQKCIHDTKRAWRFFFGGSFLEISVFCHAHFSVGRCTKIRETQKTPLDLLQEWIIWHEVYMFDLSSQKKTCFGRKDGWNSFFFVLSMCFRWRFQSPNLGEPNVCFFHGNLKQLQEAAFVQIKCCSFLFETKESRWHVVQYVLVAFFLRIFLGKWWHNVATFPSNVHLVHPKIHRIYWRNFYECKVCLQI